MTDNVAIANLSVTSGVSLAYLGETCDGEHEVGKKCLPTEACRDPWWALFRAQTSVDWAAVRGVDRTLRRPPSGGRCSGQQVGTRSELFQLPCALVHGLARTSCAQAHMRGQRLAPIPTQTGHPHQAPRAQHGAASTSRDGSARSQLNSARAALAPERATLRPTAAPLSASFGTEEFS